jgi:RNA polymerase sigma-70 factor (ECF subfamily)
MTDSDALAPVHRPAERLARQSYGRLLAMLAARTRDVAGAEDALADAFASALRAWPGRGIPENPDAWLLTAARHRQIDAARRRQTHSTHEEHVRRMVDELGHAAQTSDEIPDRRLALMFACAHPAIDAATRAPLMLQTILGLTAEAIAQAFLVPPATMGQRLSRAKARIRQAGIPFRVPDREELPERLDAVLEAIYATYSRGWVETGEGAPSPFTDEALWLGQIVGSLLPAEPEAKGLLALMLYADARRAARRDRQGAYVPLDEQDVTVWDVPQLQEAEALLRAASAGGPSGRYQLEAAIQSAHVARRLSNVTCDARWCRCTTTWSRSPGRPSRSSIAPWRWPTSTARSRPSTRWRRSPTCRACSPTSRTGRPVATCWHWPDGGPRPWRP